MDNILILQSGQININSDGQAEILDVDANNFIRDTLQEYEIIRFVMPNDPSMDVYVIQDEIQFNGNEQAVVLSVEANDFISTSLSQSGSIGVGTPILSAINVSKCTETNTSCDSNGYCK